MSFADRPKLRSIALYGGSGERFVFDLYLWPAHFAAMGGVFVVTRVIETSGDGTEHQVLYVRATGNLSLVNRHLDVECLADGLIDCIGVIPVASQSVRHRVEAELRIGLNPPCNRCWPPEPDSKCLVDRHYG